MLVIWFYIYCTELTLLGPGFGLRIDRIRAYVFMQTLQTFMSMWLKHLEWRQIFYSECLILTRGNVNEVGE